MNNKNNSINVNKKREKRNIKEKESAVTKKDISENHNENNKKKGKDYIKVEVSKIIESKKKRDDDKEEKIKLDDSNKKRNKKQVLNKSNEENPNENKNKELDGKIVRHYLTRKEKKENNQNLEQERK